MTVALDVLSGPGGTGTAGHSFHESVFSTPFTQAAFINITPGATLLTVGFEVQGGTPAPGTMAVNWDSTGTNQAMTLIGTVKSDGATAYSSSIALFGLVNPTSGSHTLSWTASGASNDGYLIGASWTGTETSSVAAATYGFASAADANTAGSTASVTTGASIATGDAVFSIFVVPATAFTGAYNASAVGIDEDGSGSNGFAASRQAGAGSTITSTATISGSDHWAAMVVGIKVPASSSTLGSSMQMLVM